MIDIPHEVLNVLLTAYRSCEDNPDVVGNCDLSATYGDLCNRLDQRAPVRVTEVELESLLYHADLACGEKLGVTPYANLRGIRTLLHRLNPGKFNMSPITYQYELVAK